MQQCLSELCPAAFSHAVSTTDLAFSAARHQLRLSTDIQGLKQMRNLVAKAPPAQQAGQRELSEEQLQARAAAKKAKKQRQKAKKQQAQSPPPRSSDAADLAADNSGAQASDAADSHLQDSAQDAHDSDDQGSDVNMLHLFRCPITKVVEHHDHLA